MPLPWGMIHSSERINDSTGQRIVSDRKEPTDEEIVRMHEDRKARRNARDRAKRRALREAGAVKNPGPVPDAKIRTRTALTLFGLWAGATTIRERSAETGEIISEKEASREAIADAQGITKKALDKRLERLVKKAREGDGATG
jgi:hypothetical protein